METIKYHVFKFSNCYSGPRYRDVNVLAHDRKQAEQLAEGLIGYPVKFLGSDMVETTAEILTSRKEIANRIKIQLLINSEKNVSDNSGFDGC